MYYFVCICQLKASSINKAINGEKQSFRKKSLKAFINHLVNRSIIRAEEGIKQRIDTPLDQATFCLLSLLSHANFFYYNRKKNEQKMMSIMLVSSIHVLKGVNFAQIFKHGTISVISWEFKISLSSQIQFQKTYWAQSLLQNKS